MRSLYFTHPEVRLDVAVPVPLWGLSAQGLARAEALAAGGVVPPGCLVFSSRETKALELAELLAAVAGTLVLTDHAMGENDRSATGFLPPELFEETADRFFAAPDESVLGWERASDAQRRIVDAVTTALASAPPGVPVIFCGHGAVGTLLKCHVGRRPISRSEDQRHMAHPGGGNGFWFDLDAWELVSDWMPMEELDPASWRG